jgi:hypothetical protein
LTLQIEKLELELDITKAEDQLVLAQNRLDLYIKSVAIAGQQGSIYNEQTAQELRDIVAARQADVNELKKQSDEHDDVAAKRIASLNNEMDELENLDALRKEGINEVVNNEEKLSAIAQTLANAEAEARRLQKAGLISIEEMNNRILSAYQSEAGAVNTLITRVNALKTTSDTALSVQNDLLQSLNNNLTVASTNYANLYEQIKAGGKKPIDAANFKAQIDAIIEIETNAKKAIDDMLLEEGVDREALMQRRVAAEQAAANALQVLWEQHGIEIDRELRINNVGAWNDTKVVIDRAADSQKNYNERLKEQQEIQKTIDDTKQGEERAATTLREQELEYQLLLAKRTGNLDEIKRIEHEIMMFQLEQDEHFNNALIGTQEELIASQERLNRAAAGNALLDMLGDYQNKIHEIDATTAQMFEKQREEALKTAEAFKGLDGYDELIININKYYDELQKKDAIDKFTENMQQGLQYVSQAVQAISGIILAHLKKDTDERKRILDQELKDDLKRHDDKYKNLLENLDKETQARLYAMGYVEAATEEQHEVELQKSMESSDQRRIFEAESALERVRIEEEAKNNRERLEQELADTREEIEKTSAQKKVQIDYEMSMAEWRAQMAKAAISIAQAILTGYAQMGPLGGSAGAAIMGGIATAQLGAIAANKPVYTLPAFDSGGIVPGSSLWGDRILTRQNSGEMDINRHDQQALWDFIRNGSQTKQEPQIIQLTVISQLDGRVVAKNTVEYINNCQELIKRGSIV